MALDHDAISQYGSYRVIREIGRGGMGVVYEVENVETSQRCALKVLPAVRSTNARIVERFRREAEATGRIHHRNIIGVHHSGCEQGLHYFVMDLVDGRNLEDIIFRLRRNTEDVGDFLSSVSDEISDGRGATDSANGVEYSSDAYIRTMAQLIREVADALHVSHAAGLVHRDIKPSNLILSREGRLVLTDFGLVQDMQAQTFTQTGEVLGTPLYMSPEQIAGRSKRSSGLTDVYSLGATLYEALSLKPPFAGSDLPSLVYQIQFVDPPSLSLENPGVPKGLSDIVAQAMAKVPSRRFESAAEFAKDLGRFLDGKPVKARAPGRVSRFRQVLSRHPEIKTSLMVAVGIVVLVVGYEVFDLISGKRQGMSEFNSYADDSDRLLEAGDYGPAWRAIEEALRRSPEDTSAMAQRGRILQHMLVDIQSTLDSTVSINEPLRLVQQMHRFAATHPLTIVGRQQVLRALKVTIRKQAVEQEYGLAQDLLERYRSVLQEMESDAAARAGVEALRALIARDLMEAAVRAFDGFEFKKITVYLEAAEAFGVGATLPSPDTRLLQDFSGRGWTALQDLAQRALSSDISLRARAISEMADARVFVRLPYQASTRLVRRLLIDETEPRLRQGLLDLVRDLRLNDMAGELLAMVRVSRDLEPQIVPVFQTARDPRCRRFLIDVALRESGAQLDDAIAALGSYRDPEVKKVLLRILSRVSSQERKALCCWALARINAVEAGPEILRLAIQSSGEPSAQMVAALVKLRVRASVDDVRVLREKSQSGPLQALCLRLLAGNATQPVIEYLVDVLNSPASDEIRAEAALALGRCRSKASVAVVKQILFNENEPESLRIHAALALGQLPGSESVTALGRILKSDESDGLRLASARALGSRRGDAAASALLQSTFGDDDMTVVRREAVFALTRMKYLDAIALFVRTIRAYDPGGTAAVLNTLADAGTSSARAFSGLLQRIGLTDGPEKTDGLKPEERLVIALCQAFSVFAQESSWDDQASRTSCADALKRLLTLPRAPAPIQAAAITSLAAFPSQMTATGLQLLMKGLSSSEVQRAGVLSLARLGESRPAHEFFSQLTDYSPMDCFNYARVWGLAGNTSRAGVWLTKAMMLGFNRLHLVRNTRELDAACRSSRVRVLFDL